MHSSFAPRCSHISVLSRSNRRHRLRRIPECCAYASTSRNFSSKHASTPARKVVVTKDDTTMIEGAGKHYTFGTDDPEGLSQALDG